MVESAQILADAAMEGAMPLAVTRHHPTPNPNNIPNLTSDPCPTTTRPSQIFIALKVLLLMTRMTVLHMSWLLLPCAAIVSLMALL
jgi:hypothetical protein